MRIREATSNSCRLFTRFCSSGDYSLYIKESYGTVPVGICFINDEGRYDRTEFDIEPDKIDFRVGRCKDLEGLWDGFCRENGFDPDSVTEVEIPFSVITYTEFRKCA
ncbi:MAG: hypothetical protein LUE14_07765 [Clostridiales bacterium]|nr:hypothetical protein [Clostridiales bacterium]